VLRTNKIFVDDQTAINITKINTSVKAIIRHSTENGFKGGNILSTCRLRHRQGD